MVDYEGFHLNQPSAFLQFIRTGEKYGYEKCCAFQFASDSISDKLPFKLRGLIKREDGKIYVPCDSCAGLRL